MSAYHVVLIKSNDPGKLLIIRRDKSADRRYLLNSDISRRRLIIKPRSPVPGGIMRGTRGRSICTITRWDLWYSVKNQLPGHEADFPIHGHRK